MATASRRRRRRRRKRRRKRRRRRRAWWGRRRGVAVWFGAVRNGVGPVGLSLGGAERLEGVKVAIADPQSRSVGAEAVFFRAWPG
jgi:hypothetical protein